MVVAPREGVVLSEEYRQGGRSVIVIHVEKVVPSADSRDAIIGSTLEKEREKRTRGAASPGSQTTKTVQSFLIQLESVEGKDVVEEIARPGAWREIGHLDCFRRVYPSRTSKSV